MKKVKSEVILGLLDWIKINNPDLLKDEHKLNSFLNLYVGFSIIEGESEDILDMEGEENESEKIIIGKK